MKYLALVIGFISLGLVGCQSTPRGASETVGEAAVEPIRSNFSRLIKAPREKVYAIVADVENHPRLLPNIKGRLVLRGPLIDSLNRPNEQYTFSVAVEPVDRPAFTRFEFRPPSEIVEQVLTNPFTDDIEPLDRKKGKIRYIFEEVPEGTRFTAISEFQPTTGRFYRQAFIDATWQNFLDRLEEAATKP